MIVVVASFHVPCFSYAPEHTMNHISETPADFAYATVHVSCKLCSQSVAVTAEVIPYQEHWKRITKVER